jgi:hypothetical protein
LRVFLEASHGLPAVDERHFEVHQNYVRVLSHGQTKRSGRWERHRDQSALRRSQ